MLSIGLDLGSFQAKAALLDDRARIDRTFCFKRGPDAAGAFNRFLDEVAVRFPRARLRLGSVGECAVPSTIHVTLANSVLAVGAAVRKTHPSARNVIEVGGHSSKFLVLRSDGGIRDFATNEACAAGTGSFLEQQARRLGLTPSELSNLAAGAARAATIAGRCSVFAASDMIHLQQKGTPLPEIAYGLCMAIARNFLSTLLKGRDVAVPVVLAGGCSLNLGIVRAFREVLGLSPGDLLVSAFPGSEGAIGAAMAAAHDESETLELADVRLLVDGLVCRRRGAPDHLPRLHPGGDRARRVEPEAGNQSRVSGFLGIDVGSVSTDLVVLDPDGNVLSSIYLPTRGRPAEVLLEGLSRIEERFNGHLDVLSCGATGSGRYLAGKLAGADVVKNEITCQLLGAKHYVPAVETILEIGGQDSKFISVKDGQIAGFAMNKVCAAGTGSFLEEQARELGIDVCGDFATSAFAAAAPLDLGSRCTVFMETEVANALTDGSGVEEISAGLAYSIARNYLDKVAGTRPLGKEIVFQGGVASNEAVVAAFESVLGRPVHVHPFNRISGAIGAALAARAARAGSPSFVSRFRGFAPRERLAMKSFECLYCSNRCEVNIVETGRGKENRIYFGDTCERYTSGGAARSSSVPNLAEEYVRGVEALFPETDGPGRRIGIPRASSLFGTLPFWATFWKEMGLRPLLSAPSSQETLGRGLKGLSVGVCLPIKLMAGHVQELVERGVDHVFVPAVMTLPGDEPSFTCPYTMAVPFIIGSANSRRFLAPVIRFEGENAFAAGFEPYLELLEATRERVREAFRAAAWAQQEFDDLFRQRVRIRLSSFRGNRVFAVLGRPYNLLDSYMNLGLFERLRRLDVLGIPQSLFPGLDRPEEERSTLPWRLPADMHDAAVALSKVEGVSPVVISCFGCGPDAFTLRRIDAALSGKPHLVLEFDEHRGEAGLVTRLEAFIDQLEGTQSQRPSRLEAVLPSVAFIPEEPARVRIPYFADLAFAFSGLFRVKGHDAKVLPLPGPEVKALGERYSLGKECHAYSMIVGDLLHLAKERTEETPVPETVFYFPGTSIPCLLYEYGSGMQGLLRELHIEGIRVSSPTGRQLINAFGIEAMDRFYVGVLAIEILAKAVCEIRPYEMERGETDEIHRANLRRIEESIATGNVLEALRESLGRLGEIEVEELRDRPTVGIAGDIYTKVNPAANADLVRWLEDRGLEVWPSPFQIDLIDLSISRSLYRSVESLDLPGFLLHGSVALRRAVDLWQVRGVVGSRVSRLEEPGYLELKRLAAPYMPNEAHDLLYTNVAKIVDFARNGADGIVNAICFGCMVGNASAAVIERIRRDYDDIPIITAVYSGASDPSRNMVLEAFASQVIARHRRRKAAQGALLASRLLARTREGRWIWPFAAP